MIRESDSKGIGIYRLAGLGGCALWRSMGACGTTETSRRTTQGAAIGAGAGALLGRSTGSMAMGALIGSGIGYIAGNADDRALAEAQAKAEQDALERSRLSSDPATV